MINPNTKKYITRVTQSDLRILVNIMNCLRGANNSKLHSLNGMFLRSYDFEQSTKFVKQQLFDIDIIAENFKNKGYDCDAFIKAAEDRNIVIDMRTSDSFSTISLGVALRHFVNDVCRVLEPTVKLLEKKIEGVPAKKGKYLMSLNKYIGVVDNKKDYEFDGDFFKALYEEVWNDYKHEESSGINASGYIVKNDILTKPVVIGSSRLSRFKRTDVEQFIDDVLSNVEQYLNYIK